MTKLTYSFSMSLDQIDQGVEALVKRDAKTDTDWHKIACSVLHNWAESGAANVAAEKATNIVRNARYRNQAITDWFTLFAGFEWDAKDKKFSYTRTKLEHEDESAAQVFQKAKSNPFGKVSPPKEVKAFNLDKEIQRLIDKAKKRMAETDESKKSDEDKINADHVTALQAILQTS